jgi:hypothetical protein
MGQIPGPSPILISVKHAAALLDLPEGGFRWWLRKHRQIPGLVVKLGPATIRINYARLRAVLDPESPEYIGKAWTLKEKP